MDQKLQDIIKQCCQGGSQPVTPRPSWHFEPCEKLTDPNIGFLVADTDSLMVSLDTYRETVRLLGGTLPPSIPLTDEAKAFQKALILHRP